MRQKETSWQGAPPSAKWPVVDHCRQVFAAQFVSRSEESSTGTRPGFAHTTRVSPKWIGVGAKDSSTRAALVEAIRIPKAEALRVKDGLGGVKEKVSRCLTPPKPFNVTFFS